RAPRCPPRPLPGRRGRAAARNPEVAAQPAVAGLDVAQDLLRVVLERLPEPAEAATDRARVRERLVGGLLRGGNSLRGLLAGLLAELERLLLGLLANLSRLLTGLGRRLLGLADRVAADLLDLAVDRRALLGELGLDGRAALVHRAPRRFLDLLGGGLGRI